MTLHVRKLNHESRWLFTAPAILALIVSCSENDEFANHSFESLSIPPAMTNGTPLPTNSSSDSKLELSLVSKAALERLPLPEPKQYEDKYLGKSISELSQAHHQLSSLFMEIRDEASMLSRRRGHYISTTPTLEGSLVKPQEIAPGILYRFVVNPEESISRPDGRTTVWYIPIPPDLFPDIYLLRHEIDWLNSHTH